MESLFNNILYINFAKPPQKNQVKLLNTYGNIVYKTTDGYINTYNLPNGIYFLQIETESISQVKKVIIIH